MNISNREDIVIYVYRNIYIYILKIRKYNRLSETKAQNLINTANRRDVMRKGEKERDFYIYITRPL